jgi:hypothetical protein
MTEEIKPPKPFPSWTWSEQYYEHSDGTKEYLHGLWEAPTALPESTENKKYYWSEENLEWVEIND